MRLSRGIVLATAIAVAAGLAVLARSVQRREPSPEPETAAGGRAHAAAPAPDRSVESIAAPVAARQRPEPGRLAAPPGKLAAPTPTPGAADLAAPPEATTVSPYASATAPLASAVEHDRDLAEVVAAQPRLDSFAAERERIVAKLVAQLLADHTDGAVPPPSVECRTSACAIALDVSRLDNERINDLMLAFQQPAVADGIGFSGGPGRPIQVSLFFDEASRDNEVYRKQLDGIANVQGSGEDGGP